MSAGAAGTSRLLENLRHLAWGGLVGGSAGVGAAVLQKLLNEPKIRPLQRAMQIPTEDENADSSILDPEEAVTDRLATDDALERKAASVEKEAGVLDWLGRRTLAQTGGALMGLYGGYRGTGELVDVMRGHQLDKALEERKRMLDELLLEEQRMATSAGGEVRRKAAAFDEQMTKLASEIVLQMEKQGVGLTTLQQLADPFLLQSLSKATDAGKTLLLLTGLATGAYGASKAYDMAQEVDKNRMIVKALEKKLLAERLAGGPKLRPGPMGISLDVDPESMTPMHPGAKALVNPEVGRDFFSRL